MINTTKSFLTHISYAIKRSGDMPEIQYYILQHNTLNKSAPWHIIMQGSSVDSVSPEKFDTQKSSKHLLTTTLAETGVPVVLIEKPGIQATGKNEDIIAHYNTIDYRAQDLCTVIEDLQSKEPQKSVVLIGASEGAEVVLRAANHIKKIDSIILMAWVTEQSPQEMIVSYLVQKYLPKIAHRLLRPSINWYVQNRLEKIAIHPNAADRFWLGNSYRYWASFMQQNPEIIVKYTNIPLLVIQGSDDLLLEGNERLLRELQLSTKKSVTWLRYADAGHRLPLNEVVNDCIRWLKNVHTRKY